MKRHYPFNDFGSFHQMKMHIRDKELDLGIESETRMPFIYDKTINTLLRNARNNWCDIIKKAHDNVNGQLESVSDNGQLGLKKKGRQMMLDINGKLIGHSDKSSVQMAASSTCCSCAHLEMTSTKCHFCEKLMCFNCCQRCSRCCELFCPLCSIKSYNEKEETALCLSCS